MATKTKAPPIKRAYALAYAMRARPTPALASAYFDALRSMLDAQSSTQPDTTRPDASPVPHG